MRRTIAPLVAALGAAAALSCGGSTEPNLPPTVTITGPAAGASFFVGDPVTFTGSGSDPETGPLTGSRLSWSSSLDGSLGTGASLVTSGLSAGAHVVTLTATDAGGASGAAQVSVQLVVNQPPVVTIASPADGAEFVEGTPVPISGSATDPEDGSVPGSRLAWSSSLDGALGGGADVSTSDLSVGVHEITLTATDGRGLAGSSSVEVTVVENGAPSATISEPADGSEFLQGADVTFTGAGTDPEEGALTGASLSWSSSLDGALGTGTSVTESHLSMGDHVVTLTATDAQGRTGTASVSVRITSPTGLFPTADFSVDCTGLTCDFTDASSDADGTVQAWSWEFGDGETSSDPSPQHVFPTGGPFTVSLIVTDDAGNESDAAVEGLSLSTPVQPGFQVEVRVSPGSSLTTTQRAAVESAVARWEELITGDLAQNPVQIPANVCGATPTPALDETVDDLVIYLSFQPIDGAGGILGQAGPCFVRLSGFPVLGVMRFDSADLANLETQARLEDVFLHEMGHVLGFGTLWNVTINGNTVFDFLRDPTSPASTTAPDSVPSNDTHFDGPLAIQAFDDVSDPDYTAGARVPLENDNQTPSPVFGAGSLNGHWREGIFGNELMTPAIGFGANPLSLVTVEALRDMGYVVNAAAADPYGLSFNLLADQAAPVLDLGDDVRSGPIGVVDGQGRTVGVAEVGP